MTGRLWSYFVTAEGSTRSMGILRIGLGLILWARYARQVSLWRHPGDLEWNLLGLSFYGATTLFVLGLGTRVAKWWLVATILYLAGPLAHEPFQHHHTTLLNSAVVLLALAPCGRSYSLDRVLALRKGAALPERAPLWGLRLITLQLVAIYFLSGWDKVSWAYLSGARLQHMVMRYYTGADLPGPQWIFAIAAVGSVLFELGVGFGLYVRRLRVPLFVCGVVFHGLLHLVFPVQTFSVTIVLLYLAYADPDAVHRFTERLGGADVAAPAAHPS